MSSDRKYGPFRSEKRKFHGNQHTKTAETCADQSVNTRLVSVPSQSCVNLPSTSKETVANSGDATPTSRFESKIQDLQVQMHV